MGRVDIARDGFLKQNIEEIKKSHTQKVIHADIHHGEHLHE